MEILLGILALFVLYLLLKLLKVSIPVITKIVWNGVIGLVALLIFNFIGGLIGLNIEITVLNALVAGLLGIPGIILLLIF